MTMWHIEARDMRTGEAAAFEVEAETEGEARHKAKTAGFWVGPITRQPEPGQSQPGLVKSIGQVVGDLLTPRVAPRYPRAQKPEARPLQTSEEQILMIVMIAIGVAIGNILTWIIVAVVIVGLIGAAFSNRQPPSFSTPPPAQRGHP